jgi:vesicle-fusing ATPase
MTIVALSGPAALTPGLRVPDANAAWWLSQVHIRLRREVGWCWLQRSGRNDPRDGSLPPQSDAGSEALDWVRFQDRKRRFLAEDPTSRYLTACLQSLERPDSGGAWARAAERLALKPAGQFLLALALAQRLDAGLAPVFAACMNDHARPYPTAALAQRLWDDPVEVAVALAGGGALVRSGLIRRAANTEADWLAPLDMPAGVACALAGLADPDAAAADALSSVTTQPAQLTGEGALIAWRLAGRIPQRLEIVPLSGPQGADFAAWATALSAPGGRPLRHAPVAVALTPAVLSEVSTLAWLGDADLLLPEGLVDGSRRLDPVLAECQDAPVRWFLPASDRQALTALPAALMLPEVRVPALDYQSRLNLLMQGLDSRGERVRTAVEDCARRFRLEAPALRRVTDALVTHPALDAQVMVDACRMEAQLHLGPLAQRVVPRFTADELVLPPAQARQFAEIAQAMRSLARVHHQWGTAKAWNESGLAVLFCGPPGTGKTMAAEALADALGLELYRIDLAQVVDKYIGETEKNLRRIFDAAEASDCLLFFDEADALFGKRTEVKDARDRFANIEISYLLERMERLRGLAILATNRRKDLDEAFMRRLRAVIEFPVPGAAERERIWRSAIPFAVDASELDFGFLARQFVLAGGHIRSVVFNACLQAADRPVDRPLPLSKVGRLEMRDVLIQVRREQEKLGRAAGDAQFGAYAERIAEWAA